MKDARTIPWRKMLLCAALLLALLVAGLSAVAETTDALATLSPSELAAQVQAMAERLEALEAERALDIRLNRAELETLPLKEGPIYVTGLSPQTQTRCAAQSCTRSC